MNARAIQDMINRAVAANAMGVPVHPDPFVIEEEASSPEGGGGFSGYDIPGNGPDRVSLNLGCGGDANGKLQIYDFDNDDSVLAGDEYHLACLLDFAGSAHKDEFHLLARDSNGKLKYLKTGVLEVPNYDGASIDYDKWSDTGSARGCGCYFELRGFGCSATWGYCFVDVIEDDHYLCGRSIDVLCRVREGAGGDSSFRLEYLRINKQISGGGGGGTETWKNGRFSLQKTVSAGGVTTFATQNTFLYVGGAIRGVSSANMSEGINYLMIDMTTGAVSYQSTTSETDLMDAAGCLAYYVIPLYTISNGSVSLDWRIGPSAIMEEM